MRACFMLSICTICASKVPFIIDPSSPPLCPHTHQHALFPRSSLFAPLSLSSSLPPYLHPSPQTPSNLRRVEYLRSIYLRLFLQGGGEGLTASSPRFRTTHTFFHPCCIPRYWLLLPASFSLPLPIFFLPTTPPQGKKKKKKVKKKKRKKKKKKKGRGSLVTLLA